MSVIVEQMVESLKINKSTWKLTKFGEVAIQQKKNVNRDDTHLTKYVKGEHMYSQDLHLREWGELTDEYLGPAFIRYFDAGDILYGSRRTYLRKVVIAPFEGITSNTTFVIKANEEKIDKRLLAFVMMTDEFSEHSVRNSKGSVNPYINWKDIANYEFLLPPKEEQKKLAELLWAMDDVIEKEKRLLNNINLTYVSTIEKELLDKKFSKVFLSEMGSVIRGVSYNPEDLVSEYTDDDCIILRSNNISNGMVNYNDIKILPICKVKKEQILVNNDFAICMSNGSKELVGKSSRYYYNDKNVATGSFCAGFRPQNEEFSDLLNHLFFSETYRQAIKRTLSGSAINNLKPSDIEELSFRIKPKNDRTVIIEKLNRIVSSKNITEETINSSKSLQKSLINQIF